MSPIEPIHCLDDLSVRGSSSRAAFNGNLKFGNFPPRLCRRLGHCTRAVFVPKDTQKVKSRNHHRVYVVLLENPCGDGRAGYYVGMSGLPPQERFANHKRGYKSARIVKEHGVALAWEWFADIPSMSYKEAALAEPTLADDLRDLGFLVYGPTNRKLCRLRRRPKE